MIRDILTFAPFVAALALGGLVLHQREQISAERAAHAETRAQHAQQLQRIAEATATAATAARHAQQAQQQAVAALDIQHTQELSHALADNDALRADLRSGARRLRIAASCPTGSSAGAGVPGTASTAGLDAGTTVELGGATGQAVLDLREDLLRDRAKLAGLQEYARRLRAGGADALAR
ncbi:lysis system i-spanin subunit Rz [Pseudorhodoferax sp.]|uniref:lysis system i-spanin subunit Rz n=1 Tax=Pseudorhodoferax sp. TaxID=1993553 RepID=UPI0039E5FD0F